LGFVAPGIATCTLAIFIQEMAWLIPFGVVLLGFGLFSLVGYMIWQRWKWCCYVLPSEIVQQVAHADGPASGGPAA